MSGRWRVTAVSSLALFVGSVCAGVTLAQTDNRDILGVRKPAANTAPPELRTPVPQPVGTADQVVQLAKTARANAWMANPVQDSTFEGTLTMFNVRGPSATFGVTLMRKGSTQVQRIVHQNGRDVKQGSDGTSTWNSSGILSSSAGGPTLHFIESLTSRSIQALVTASPQGTPINDLGMKGSTRVLEVQGDSKREDSKTRYFIDADSTVSRIEIGTGEVESTLLNRKLPTFVAVVFSDYRDVGGVLTPFKIETFENSTKVEEMQFQTVAHNQAVADRVFKP